LDGSSAGRGYPEQHGIAVLGPGVVSAYNPAEELAMIAYSAAVIRSFA
jgi:hypothetical protein